MTNDLLSIEEEIFKVIGNKKRLEILLLLEDRELNVTEMTDMLGLRQANLSQHLTLLRSHHLVLVRKAGRESFYKLADDSIAATIRTVHDFLRRQHNITAPFDSTTLFPIVSDPVCGMRFSVSKAHSHVKQNGKLYYFCASGCEIAFNKRAALIKPHKSHALVHS